MASFDIAFEKIKELEGGYVNNPADSGGETFVGISRRWNPSWGGWVIVDHEKESIHNLSELSKSLLSNVNIIELVKVFYKFAYWDFDTIDSQEVVNKVCSIVINFGKSRGIHLLQSSLGSVTVDGQLGPKTIAAVNDADPIILLHELSVNAIMAHVDLVMRKPDQHAFLRGWIRRDLD